MAQEYTEQELEERYLHLPPELREALFSVEHAQQMYEIGKKSGLNVEQIGALAQESGYLIIGITHPHDFAANLSRRLGVDLEKARAIATEINHQIFYPLRELLKSAHKIDVTQEQINKPPTPPSPVLRPLTSVLPTPRTTEPPKPAPSISAPPVPAPAAPKAIDLAQESRPPMSPLPPSTTQQEKKTSSIPPIVLSKLPGVITETIAKSELPSAKTPAVPALAPPKQLSSIPPILLKPLGTKEPAPSEAPPQPIAPSQVMEKKMLEERRIQPAPDTISINESIFAPPSAPAQSPTPPVPSLKAPPPSAQRPGRPQPAPPPPPQGPTPYQKDPYREPVE